MKIPLIKKIFFFFFLNNNNNKGVLEFLRKTFAPQRYGFHYVDAINHYTTVLQKLNDEVKELQIKYINLAKEMDVKLRNRFIYIYF
jgi:hypothetical protein